MLQKIFREVYTDSQAIHRGEKPVSKRLIARMWNGYEAQRACDLFNNEGLTEDPDGAFVWYNTVNREPYGERHFFIDTVQKLKETLRDANRCHYDEAFYLISSDKCKLSFEAFEDTDILKYAYQWIKEQNGYFCLLQVGQHEEVICKSTQKRIK